MIRWAAVAAYVNAAMALAQLLTSGGDPRADGVLGILNNAAGVVWAASFVPVGLLLYRLAREKAQVAAAAAFAVGLVGMAGAAGLEVAVATGRMSFGEQTVGYYPVLGALGVWLVMSGAIALIETDLDRGPLGFGIAIGALWFAANVLFGIGGVPTDLEHVSNDLSEGGVALLELGLVLQAFWGLWLGRALRARGAPPPRGRT